MKGMEFVEEEYNSELHHHTDKYMELIFRYIHKRCVLN